LNSSLIVIKSAKAWQGCSKSVRALITGFEDHFAYSSKSSWLKVLIASTSQYLLKTLAVSLIGSPLPIEMLRD
jgi:hypothetical protein